MHPLSRHRALFAEPLTDLGITDRRGHLVLEPGKHRRRGTRGRQHEETRRGIKTGQPVGHASPVFRARKGFGAGETQHPHATRLHMPERRGRTQHGQGNLTTQQIGNNLRSPRYGTWFRRMEALTCSSSMAR